MNKSAELEADPGVREILKGYGVFEAHRVVAEYRGYRTRGDGQMQAVVVRIFDMGPDAPQSRYRWDVSVPDAVDSEPVSANPAASIIDAGHAPHWNLLDSDARMEER